MQATNQVAAAKIAAPKSNFIQQPVALGFSGKIIFNHLIITSMPRFASSGVHLSFITKKLVQTTNPSIEHLMNIKLDNRKLKFQLLVYD